MTNAWSVPFERLAAIDPGPFFVLSLLPYLAFLWWASKVEAFPRLALRGFQLTLVFVAVTIAAAIVAQVRYRALLANVDGLHGGAEAFLTLSNLLVMLGFALAGSGDGCGVSSGENRGDGQGTGRCPGKADGRDDGGAAGSGVGTGSGTREGTSEGSDGSRGGK